MEMLDHGVLIQGERYFIKLLTEEHLQQILSLQQTVIAALDDKKLLQPLTANEFCCILTGNGMMAGVFIGSKLIAFRALLVPSQDEEHLGIDVGIKDLSRVIYQEISNVHPDYRGNRLQQKLAGILMKELKQSSLPHDYVCCTVAPFNIPSLKDKFAQGMQIAALKEKYGGSLRYVFVLDLTVLEAEVWKETCIVQMKDVSKQQALLKAGWRGVRLAEEAGVYAVEYKRV